MGLPFVLFKTVISSVGETVKSVQWVVMAWLLGLAAVSSAASERELFRAARSGQAPAIHTALKAGADINTRFDIGKTALIVAAERGHAAAVEVLMDAGADLYVLDNNGVDALGHAGMNAHVAVMRMMLAKGYDPSRNNWASLETLKRLKAIRPLLPVEQEIAILEDARRNYRGSTTTATVSSGGSGGQNVVRYDENLADPILIDVSERNVTSEIFKSVAVKALTGRGWSVLKSEPNQITATLSKGDREYRVSVSIKPGILIKIGFVAGHGSDSPNWLNNLKKDMESHLRVALSS